MSLISLFMSMYSWYVSLIIALIIAPIAALTELFTKGGWDTISVPSVVAIILLMIRIIC